MKKNIWFLFLIMVIIFSSCASKTIQNPKETMMPTTEYFSAVNNETTTTPYYNTTTIFENDVGGGEIVQQKYRQCYYNITYQLSLLVNKNELKAWEEEIYAKDPNETNEMVVKLFVQHFNISKEDFEKANLESAKVIYDPNSPLPSMNPKDYINQEMFELYNADIIYTFDDQIINEYYLSGEYPFVYESDFEQAVAKGEYTPRTEVWVDVEAMEAEIIAKYGETEIIPEEPTDIPEVTDALPQESESTQITEAVTI